MNEAVSAVADALRRAMDKSSYEPQADAEWLAEVAIKAYAAFQIERHRDKAFSEAGRAEWADLCALVSWR